VKKPPSSGKPDPSRKAKSPARSAKRSSGAASALVTMQGIANQLKAGPEQQTVVGPLIQYLVSLGWNLGQLRFGTNEWRVPKSPSEATKRERKQSFAGWPCDIAVFDSPTRVDPRHVLVIVETKALNDEAGVSQLEAYFQAEPHAKLGIWTSSADPSAGAVFVYRKEDGTLVQRRRPLSDLPRPGEAISATLKRLSFADLTVPSKDTLSRIIEDMLNRVVVEDTNVNRREDQLDQLCGLILLKLHSDKRSRIDPKDPPIFRLFESAERTAEEMRRRFSDLVRIYPDTFQAQDSQLRLSRETIYQCVERLAPYRLIDVGIHTTSLAFQLLRTAALKMGEGQFFTPQSVIDAAVRLMNVTLDDLVIDPACGTGGFLVGVLLDIQQKYPGHAADISRWAQTNIYGIDKDAIAVKLTKAMMQIAGDGSAHCVRGDSVRTHLWANDFSHMRQAAFADGRFSVVITNPPFGKKLTVSPTDARLSSLDISQAVDGESWAELEIGFLFLQRSYQLLRSGGRLGIVLPETYFFSPNYTWIFNWMKSRLRPMAVADIPIVAFTRFCRVKTNFYVFEKIG
jgi:type I restriction enzyme M protein